MNDVLLGLCSAIGVLVLGLVLARLLAEVSSATHRLKLASSDTVIAEYEAPTQLSPAELGYMVDARFGSNELLATLASLYAKGLVNLEPLYGDDFRAKVTTAKGSADGSESSVLGYLNGLPQGSTTWKQFDSLISDTAGPQSDFEDSVLESLVGKGFLTNRALTNVFFSEPPQFYSDSIAPYTFRVR